MKCDTCKFKKFHSAGDFYAVVEGGDDPYNYDYCEKDHWCGSVQLPQIETHIQLDVDFWKDCKDYECK